MAREVRVELEPLLEVHGQFLELVVRGFESLEGLLARLEDRIVAAGLDEGGVGRLESTRGLESVRKSFPKRARLGCGVQGVEWGRVKNGKGAGRKARTHLDPIQRVLLPTRTLHHLPPKPPKPRQSPLKQLLKLRRRRLRRDDSRRRPRCARRLTDDVVAHVVLIDSVPRIGDGPATGGADVLEGLERCAEVREG